LNLGAQRDRPHQALHHLRVLHRPHHARILHQLERLIDELLLQIHGAFTSIAESAGR